MLVLVLVLVLELVLELVLVPELALALALVLVGSSWRLPDGVGTDAVVADGADAEVPRKP